ncbi:MAG: L,D-transpeptidase family protein [Desulforegulaceae bacterium]|nr:L,D-transpeptidase family protein [Desulforegulaceae bacterium]
MNQKIMRKIFLIFFILCPSLSFGIEKADSVLVIKSELKLYLIKNENIYKSYHISLGNNPKGHKIKEGDGRTPEGRYILYYKNINSAFYKSIHISFPNKEDKKKAKEKGFNPGGAIMIHGQKNRLGWLYFVSKYFNWTQGCIGLSNKNMDEIWTLVDVGTAILIKP